MGVGTLIFACSMQAQRVFRLLFYLHTLQNALIRYQEKYISVHVIKIKIKLSVPAYSIYIIYY